MRQQGLKPATLIALIVSLLAGAMLFSACAGQKTQPGSSESEQKAPPSALPAIRVGTLQTDDLLPLWVAEKESLLTKAGLRVEIQTFQSAQEQVAAVTAGELDAIMTDLVVPLQLTAAKTPMRILTVLQGAPAGIVAGKTSGITELAGLAGRKTGCSSPTVMEFIYDKALSNAGVAADNIQTEEIKKLPVRLEMLSSGKIPAAVLPWTLFTLAQQQGAVPLLAEAQDREYTSTVLAFRSEWTQQPDTAAALSALLDAWDKAVDVLNADPAHYQALLAEKAKLPDALKTSYPVRHYPHSGLPKREQLEAVVTWMVGKDYLPAPLSYEDMIYQQ
jgi:NitT/TauT family transport system substrate-binding protein